MFPSTGSSGGLSGPLVLDEREERCHDQMSDPRVVVVSDAMSVMHCVYLIRLSTAVEITYHYLTDVTIYFVVSPKVFCCLDPSKCPISEPPLG